MARINFTLEPPTARQVNFATEISKALNVPLPEEKTKQAYSKFISEHIEWYNAYTNASTYNLSDCILNPMDIFDPSDFC